MLRIQNVVRRHLQVGQQLYVAQIPRGQPEVVVFLMIYQQDLAIETELCKRLRKWLRLMTFECERFDNVQLVFFELLCKRRLQSSAKHLLGQRSFIIARSRAEYGATLAPERVSD